MLSLNQIIIRQYKKCCSWSPVYNYIIRASHGFRLNNISLACLEIIMGIRIYAIHADILFIRMSMFDWSMLFKVVQHLGKPMGTYMCIWLLSHILDLYVSLLRQCTITPYMNVPFPLWLKLMPGVHSYIGFTQYTHDYPSLCSPGAWCC